MNIFSLLELATTFLAKNQQMDYTVMEWFLDLAITIDADTFH